MKKNISNIVVAHIVVWGAGIFAYLAVCFLNWTFHPVNWAVIRFYEFIAMIFSIIVISKEE